ncbi:hypothetical protein M431DRAFT_508653 [Trichoderma harzianum CBS 226.95]|uniref:Uncharacterized protein n=1 Tax=Trichoderma harzianum CBS 226.95 TaxID=983964 RepID=A0A2T4ADT9_TRIHA|nr:hypothetical protein M431DRAFT_508653 [Trichoderma harzianum CBS 226.95]PTB55250.1 hypothetical protein M431DRAFT_508653 [Trichoderma harzianum CBS 226.95]
MKKQNNMEMESKRGRFWGKLDAGAGTSAPRIWGKILAPNPSAVTGVVAFFPILIARAAHVIPHLNNDISKRNSTGEIVPHVD